MATLPIKKGIDALPVNHIPDNPVAFVSWFKNSFLSRWASLADTRNAIPGPGISISGSISDPATVSASSEVQALFAQPYVLVGSPVAPAELTGYRSIAAQAGVLAITDGGAETTVTVSVVANGVGNGQLRQGAATSIIGNAGGATANVADISASSDNTALVRAGGVLNFSALPLATIASIASDTVLGNATAGSAAPTALTQLQLTALINLATNALSGAMPALSGVATQFLNGAGSFAVPAYPTGANPSASIGLSVVNGSSANFMRADAAPALSQAITPTWSGAHIFSPGSGVAVTINGVTAQKNLLIKPGDSASIAISVVDPGANASELRLTTTNTDVSIQTTSGGTVPTMSFRTGAHLAMQIANTGAVAVSSPTSGDALTVANVAGANALVVTGNAAGTAVVRFSTQATTGAATPTLGTVKPGSNTAASKWLPVNIDGTTMYIPLWL
jgi:hypothetical protein